MMLLGFAEMVLGLIGAMFIRYDHEENRSTANKVDERIVVNNRVFDCNRNLNSKSKLTNLAQEFNLEKPQYKVRVLNKVYSSRFKYLASVVCDGKMSEGFGSTKRRAVAKACQNYLNNSFLTGGNSLQLGKPVTAPRTKYPPNKKRRDNLKLEKMLKSKASSYVIVTYDLERSSGADDSEITNLAYTSKDGSFSCFIKPRGGIDPVASSKSSNISVKGNKMFKNDIEVQYVCLVDALKKLLEFLKQLEEVNKKKPILICHGNDAWTLINNLAYVGLVDEFMSSVHGFLDFQKIVKADPELENVPISLTNLKSGHNLSTLILGSEVKNDLLLKAHDAEFDSEILYKVFSTYMLSKKSEAIHLIEKYLKKPDSNLIRETEVKIWEIREKRRKNIVKNKLKKKKTKDFGIVYVNGWMNV